MDTMLLNREAAVSFLVLARTEKVSGARPLSNAYLSLPP